MDERTAQIFNDAMPLRGSLEVPPAPSRLQIDGATGQGDNWSLPASGDGGVGGSSNSTPEASGSQADPPTIPDVITVVNGTLVYVTYFGTVTGEV